MIAIHCTTLHTEAIRAIFNDAILNTTALYDYRPRTPGMVEAWLVKKIEGNYPVIGLEEDGGMLMGFASYGPFRSWPAYKYSVEHSVHVDERFRGRGVGKKLMTLLIEAAKGQNYHMMIGAIDATNVASVALHKSLGFVRCGVIRHAGFKFGRWLDLEFHQLLLPTPANPSED